MLFSDVIDFYQRADILEARADVGPCATCRKRFEVGEQFSMYLLKDGRPTRKFPEGILLCKKCTYIVIAAPHPARGA